MLFLSKTFLETNIFIWGRLQANGVKMGVRGRPVGTKFILGGGLKREASEARKNGGPGPCPRENFS